jgi:hypothetical protein
VLVTSHWLALVMSTAAAVYKWTVRNMGRAPAVSLIHKPVDVGPPTIVNSSSSSPSSQLPASTGVSQQGHSYAPFGGPTPSSSPSFLSGGGGHITPTSGTPSSSVGSSIQSGSSSSVSRARVLGPVMEGATSDSLRPTPPPPPPHLFKDFNLSSFNTDSK